MNYFDRVMKRIDDYQLDIGKKIDYFTISYVLGSIEIQDQSEGRFKYYEVYFKNTRIPLSQEDKNKIGEIVRNRFEKQEQKRIDNILKEL